MVNVAPLLSDGKPVPGRIYRDLDGSLVHLVSVEHDLCSWVALADRTRRRQATHCDNFRRRFRSFVSDPPVEWKHAA